MERTRKTETLDEPMTPPEVMERRDNGTTGVDGFPLMTALGLIGGEVLLDLEQHGATPLAELSRRLEWPDWMVLMGTGALVRQHLVRAMQRGSEVVVDHAQAGDGARDTRLRHRLRRRRTAIEAAQDPPDSDEEDTSDRAWQPSHA